MLDRKEIVKKLISDTETNKVKWNVIINPQWIRAEYSIEITSNKFLNFKLIYYIDHPKGTKLLVDYYVKTSMTAANHSLYNVGGKNKEAESRELLSLMNIVLLNEEKNRNDNNPNINIINNIIRKQLEESKPDFNIGDKVIIKGDPHFEMADGMEGKIVSEISDTDDTFYYLVDFEDPFYEMLVYPDFDFEKDDFKVGGTCWPFEPQFLKKIIEKEDIPMDKTFMKNKLLM